MQRGFAEYVPLEVPIGNLGTCFQYFSGAAFTDKRRLSSSLSIFLFSILFINFGCKYKQLLRINCSVVVYKLLSN